MSSPAFARWSASREAFAARFFGPVMEAAFEHLEPAAQPGAVLLDAGCGGGHVARAFAGSGATPVGIDLERHPRWSSPGPPRFAQGDIERLPLRSASVDALFCFSVLQYVDRRRALDEFARVLKPGARFAWIENLARHPGAILHRAWRRRVRGETSGPTVARGYPTWSEVERPDRRFAENGARPHALFAPVAFALPGVGSWPADLPDRAFGARTMRALEGWDRFWFERWPATRARAWMALTLGTR